MLAQGQLITKVETIIWAIPAPDVTLDELIQQFKDQGYPALEIDRINNKVKILHIVDLTEEE